MYLRVPANAGDVKSGIEFGEQTLNETEFPWRSIVYEALTSYDRPDSFHHTADHHYFWDKDGNEIAGILHQNPFAANHTHPEIMIGTTPVLTNLHAFIGICLDEPVVTVTSPDAGLTIDLNLEHSGGGDLRFVFKDGTTTVDCTPTLTVQLTPGSDTSPTQNYVYILGATGALTASTSGWPSAEYAPIATVVLQSAASANTHGPYKVHAWTDHTHSTDGNGHIAHLNKWIRARPAGWVSGCACTATGGVSNLTIATAAGVVYQLHTHTFPAFDTGVSDDIYVVNDNTTPYKRVQDLDGHVGTDSEGVAMKSYFNLVVWGVASEAGTDSKLMVNLPAGSYSNDSGSQATNDLQAYSVYTIPSQFVGCGFLIARLTISKSGSTYTIEETHDLRGTFPSTGAGASGGGAGAVEFIDNQFRIKAVADETKKLAFDISGVTTGTTRTITVPDEDFSLVDWTLATEDLYTSGYVRTDHLWLPEQASSPGSAAGNGLLWVKNTAPTTLFFTDDTGVDHDLTAGGGGGLSDVVDDLTPELGGNLDALTKNISNVQDLSADQLIIGGGTLGVETALFKQQTAASSSPTIVIESVNFLGALARLDF
ncbi:MAG: hypothetical protein ACYS7Y_33720, partial [Planctomycetota bacterium]